MDWTNLVKESDNIIGYLAGVFFSKGFNIFRFLVLTNKPIFCIWEVSRGGSVTVSVGVSDK